jgi:hypothetical protein
MSKQPSVNSVGCGEYERLLEQSRHALENWDRLRAEVLRSHLVKREVGDELVCLQTKFARAYAVLQKHTRNCWSCRLMAPIEKHEAEINSNADVNETLYV